MNNIKHSFDYRATYTSYVSGKAVHTGLPRTHIDNKRDLEKDYFIDRDKIYSEWGPGQPCRTATLIFSVPGKLLSEGINSKEVKKYGIWTKALRLAAFDTYNPEFLFRNWRWLPRRPYKRGSRAFTARTKRNVAMEERQMRSVCKTRIIVFEAGWNSINPFDENLSSAFAYTRLGYFFDIHKHQSSLVDQLYHRSKIEALFELKKKPKISFPRFTFAVNSARKAFVSQIRTGKDMIRYLALELAEKDRLAKVFKSKLNIRDFKLYQMLALNYIVRRESNATLKRIYRIIKNTPVPETLEAYKMAPVGTDFLVFMAYKKNKKAVKILRLMLDKKGYIDRDKRADYAYTLAQAGYMNLSLKMALTKIILNSFPPKILAKARGWYPYLIFGFRNDKAARRWFLKYNTGRIINNYFGKPPAEAYRDWKLEHFKRVKELKSKGEGK